MSQAQLLQYKQGLQNAFWSVLFNSLSNSDNNYFIVNLIYNNLIQIVLAYKHADVFYQILNSKYVSLASMYEILWKKKRVADWFMAALCIAINCNYVRGILISLT